MGGTSSVGKLNAQLYLTSKNLSLLYKQMENVIREVSLKWKDDVFVKISGEIALCQQQILELSEKYGNLAAKTQKTCGLL